MLDLGIPNFNHPLQGKHFQIGRLIARSRKNVHFNQKKLAISRQRWEIRRRSRTINH